MKVKGVVLAGGQSRRLGTDKALLCLPGCELTLLENATQVLSSLGLEVYLSVRADQVRPLEYPKIPDSYIYRSSMGGVASSLKALAAPCLFLPCDLPFMTSEILWRLLERRQTRPKGTLLTLFHSAGKGLMEPLIAIYEPESLPYLEQAMETQNFRLYQAIPEKNIVFVDYLEKEAHNFQNINTPQDLSLTMIHQAKE